MFNPYLFYVPFPYTTVEDYEAVVRQPIGKEWNPQRIHQKLIKPAVLTRVWFASFIFLNVLRFVPRCIVFAENG